MIEEGLLLYIFLVVFGQIHAQTVDPIPPQNLWWILVGSIGGPLIVLLVVFLCCYFHCFSKRFRWRQHSKVSTVSILADKVAESNYQQQIENVLKSHHKDCDCDSCHTSGHHSNCPCVTCGRAKQVLSHRHAECLSCSVSLLHSSKKLLCSCEICKDASNHKENLACPCSSCEVAQSHKKNNQCPCDECKKLTQHRSEEKWCNCIGCQDARVHEAKLQLKHIQTCYYCRIATIHAQQTHCTCDKCGESCNHAAQYACQCRLCQEAVTHSKYLLCKCDSCVQEEIIRPIWGTEQAGHQIKSGCMCDKCMSKREHNSVFGPSCNLPLSGATTYCPEHQDIIMRRLSDRRRRSFDSGIVDVGNSRCPHLNVTCPAHTTIALAPNSANQQPACIKCESCGECHSHSGGRGGRHRSMSDGSSDAEPSAAATRTLRKSNSTDCVNKEVSSCNTSTTSIGVQATRPAAKMHWRPHSNPMLSPSIHVFDREKFWKMQLDYVRDVKARREAYRNKTPKQTATV